MGKQNQKFKLSYLSWLGIEEFIESNNKGDLILLIEVKSTKKTCPRH